MSEESFSRKLVCIGDGTCGKTCLLVSYAHGSFPEKHVPTVFENYVANVTRPMGKVELALWDTAGQEDYAHIRPLSYDAAHVFLICFAVDNPDSFDNISTKWIPEMKLYSPKTPYVIVGCKGDLRKDEVRTKELKSVGQNFVAEDDAEALASKCGSEGYMECSAKLNDGVADVFNWAADLSLMVQPKSGCCVLL
eukprot:m.136471 g.136471  ORF g.136471 m.136471 type:complete len:194 (-) comp10684_c0_seq1:229-810(-)